MTAAGTRRAGLWALTTIVVLAVVGIAVGAGWSALAPHPLMKVAQGHSLVSAGGSGTPSIAADAYFLLVSGIAGLVTGAIVAVLARPATLWVPVALVLGGAGGAAVAWQLGSWFGSGHAAHVAATGAVGTTVHDQVSLGAVSALLAWPLAAVLAHLVVTAWRLGASPGHHEPDPDDEGHVAAV